MEQFIPKTLFFSPPISMSEQPIP